VNPAGESAPTRGATSLVLGLLRAPPKVRCAPSPFRGGRRRTWAGKGFSRVRLFEEAHWGRTGAHSASVCSGPNQTLTISRRFPYSLGRTTPDTSTVERLRVRVPLFYRRQSHGPRFANSPQDHPSFAPTYGISSDATGRMMIELGRNPDANGTTTNACRVGPNGGDRDFVETPTNNELLRASLWRNNHGR